MLRYILTIFAVLAAFTACREEGDSLSTTGKEKGRLVLGAISIEAEETHTRAVTIPKPQPEEVIIEIIDPDNFVVESGNIDHYANGIELFVARYTLRAYYGNKQTMGDSPYFEGTVTFSVTEGATTQIGTITAKLANAIIIPNIPTNIVDHFIGVPTLYVSKKGEEKRAVTNGQALYVLPGEYTLGLEGTNKLGVAVNNTQQLNTEAGKVYNINGDLKLPILELPDQTAGAWAKRLYITPVNATNSKGEKYTPKGVIYKILPKNSSNWDNAISIQDNEGTGENVIFTGLTPGTTYQVRAEMASIISNVIDVQTETEYKVPNSEMENWYSTQKSGTYWKMWYCCLENSTEEWNTLNKKTTSEGGTGTSSYAYIANSGTIKTTDAHNGAAALIRTVGWGKGSTAPGSIGFTKWDGEMKHTDSGYLYLGGYSENPEEEYYPYSFSVRPSNISFYYKYTPASGKEKSSDKFLVRVSVENRKDPNNPIILASTSFENGEEITSYTPITLNLDYNNKRCKATHIYILFKSGTVKEYKYFSVPPYNNLSDGEYVGSQLYIDDIKLEYE